MLKKISFIIPALICIFSVPVTGAAAKNIQDSFELGLTNWDNPANRHIEIVEGQLVNRTRYSSGIALKEKDIGDFELSFRLKLLSSSEPLPGHFAVVVDRGYGRWHLYLTRHGELSRLTSQFIPADAKKEDKPIFDETLRAPLPFDEWFNVTLTCNKNRYELKIGEQSFILGAAPGRGGISFGSYKQPFALDDFKIVYDKPEELSRNLVVNSSFEFATNPDIPDCWSGNGERHRTNGLLAEICTADGLKEFHNKFLLDDKQALHGKRSIRVESPYHLLSEGVSVVPRKAYTISCYLKSEVGDRKVVLGATNDSIEKLTHQKTVPVGKTWQRHELDVPDYPHGVISILVKPLDSGRIWIDSVQLEEGKTATPYMPCWLDTGFNLPDDVNLNQCGNNVNGIKATLERRDIITNKDLDISKVWLTSTNPVNDAFSLECEVANRSTEALELGLTAILASKSGAEQIKTTRISVSGKNKVRAQFDDFTISDIRCCVNIVATAPDGKTIKHTREFVDVPHPMRMYAEYSYYTSEKEARVAAEFDPIVKDKLQNCKLLLETVVAGYPQYPCARTSYDLAPSASRQIFSLPLTRLSPNIYTIKAKVVDQEGKTLMRSEAELVIMKPRKTEVRINRINRGVYVNEKPFLPYGILVSSFGDKQLRYYRECGFSFIQFISHWNTPETNLEFLANCERLGIDAIAFHVSRPFSCPPYEAAGRYRASPALVGIVPNDESADRVVYEAANLTKQACPERLVWVNHHFHSYQAFANRIDGFPGDVLSIDRYPFIVQPPGRPQSTNDIYSIEQCAEMMDRDGSRERKPVYMWLQAAERFSKEPTPQQLTWQTYIPLVNHCMGFTYFGGIPSSERVWARMIALNKEIETLVPALFSLEEEPAVTAADQTTRENIRFLAKKLGDEVIVICVNRSLNQVDATLDLAHAGVGGQRAAEALFEDREVQTDASGKLKDAFGPMERHVYRVK